MCSGGRPTSNTVLNPGRTRSCGDPELRAEDAAGPSQGASNEVLHSARGAVQSVVITFREWRIPALPGQKREPVAREATTMAAGGRGGQQTAGPALGSRRAEQNGAAGGATRSSFCVCRPFKRLCACSQRWMSQGRPGGRKQGEQTRCTGGGCPGVGARSEHLRHSSSPLPFHVSRCFHCEGTVVCSD